MTGCLVVLRVEEVRQAGITVKLTREHDFFCISHEVPAGTGSGADRVITGYYQGAHFSSQVGNFNFAVACQLFGCCVDAAAICCFVTQIVSAQLEEVVIRLTQAYRNVKFQQAS